MTFTIVSSCVRSDVEIPASNRLDEIEIPEGFDFATQRAVEVVIEATGTPRKVDILTAEGDLLYRGPLGVGPAPTFPMPSYVRQLTVRIYEPDETRDLLVDVQDGRAVVTL